MKQISASKKMTSMAAMILGLTIAVGGCSTKKYVRTTVDEKATELSARIDENAGKIQSNTNQIEELGSVTREHGNKINTLDTEIKQVDGKTQQAMNLGQTAQSAADNALQHSTMVQQELANRNKYQVAEEKKILFAFNSAKIQDTYIPVLDEVANKLNSDPDALVVMEGRTDGTGNDLYNIQLGEKRLDAALRYLIVDKGVDMHRVYKMSFGKAQPLAANETREGRAENRSVLIQILSPKADGSQTMSSNTSTGSR